MVAMKHLGYVIEVIGRIIGGPPKRKGDRLKQHQREAIIDALLYCLFADDFDDPAERQIMDRSIARMQWESDLAVNDYVQAASARIKLAVKSRDSEKQLLLDIRDRLETKKACFEVMQLCKILLYSDGFFPEKEVRALSELSQVLKG
jgi:hypothetical protein